MVKQITRQFLSENVDIAQIESVARSKFNRSNIIKRGIETNVIKLVPFALLVMIVVFYSITAPHTAYIINKITPGSGQFAPIAFEIFIFVLAIMIASGINNRLIKTLFFSILLLNILINVSGSFISVVETSTQEITNTDRLTLADLFNRFAILPAVDQIIIVLLIPVSIAIPSVSAITGDMFVRLVKGELKMNIKSDNELWLEQSYIIMKLELQKAAIALGSQAKTAQKWADDIATSMYKDSPETVQNSLLVLNSLSTLSDNDEFHEKKDSKDSPDARLSVSRAVVWLEDNPHYLNNGLTNRQLSELYTSDLWGKDRSTDRGYKTIERAKQHLNQKYGRTGLVQ